MIATYVFAGLFLIVSFVLIAFYGIYKKEVAALKSDYDEMDLLASKALELSKKPPLPVALETVFNEEDREYQKALWDLNNSKELRFFLTILEMRAIEELVSSMDHLPEKGMFLAGVQSVRKALVLAAVPYQRILDQETVKHG